MFNKEKINKMRKFEKYLIIVNVLILLTLGLLHLRVKHVRIFYNNAYNNSLIYIIA